MGAPKHIDEGSKTRTISSLSSRGLANFEEYQQAAKGRYSCGSATESRTSPFHLLLIRQQLEAILLLL